MSQTPYADALVERPAFEDSAEARDAFARSMRESCLALYERSDKLRNLWNRFRFDPRTIEKESDLERIPPVLISLLKQYDWNFLRDEEIALELSSSGTSGQRSKMVLNAGSLARVKRAITRVHEGLGITGNDVCNYLVFSYDPKAAKDVGIAFTNELMTSFTPRNEVFYAFQWDAAKNDFVYREDAVVATLERFAAQGKPVRILGFPAFLHSLLTKHDLALTLGPSSWVETIGGWKTKADQEIPRPEFNELIARSLGIPKANIRDLYGLVEHGIPYVDCERGNKHVPNYSRIFIRSPYTLEALAPGERGLIQVMCSYNDGFPTASVLTTDWGRLESCDCGVSGPTLRILGRAGVTKHKGCAISATQRLG